MRRRGIGTVRRGGALLLVVFLTVALGALAASAIALTRTTSLVHAYYERERDFRYAAEAALAIGRSRVQHDTSLNLPDSGYVVVPRAPVVDANGATLPRTSVTLYIGKSGITTGQYGQFVTVVARADDGRNTRYVRRSELAAENFARFAMFTNTWQSGLAYGTGEFIRGLAWSNQTWASVGAPTYYDTVGAVGAITASGGPPTYIKGAGSVKPNQAVIPMPTVARLAFMPGYAAGANLAFTPGANRTMRLEFVAADVDANGDSTGMNEGFVRVFESTAVSDSSARTRVKLPGAWGSGISLSTASGNPYAWVDSVCGDFHGGKFYPVAVHKQQWFLDTLAAHGYAREPSPQIAAGGGAVSTTDHDLVMRNVGARCYPAGAPQLAAVERVVGASDSNGGTWSAASTQKGGDDTTFTPNGRWGTWRRWPGAVSAPLATSRRAGQAKWLFPTNKTNPGWRGIVYVNGTAYVSGLLRSRVTLYSSASLTFLDDLTYVVPPNTPGVACEADNSNILGIIAVSDIMIEDNLLHRPVKILNSAPPAAFDTNQVRFLSGTGPHFRLHGVLLSLTGTVGVVHPLTGPSVAAGTCMGQPTSGGCIAQVGGVIEQSISATWTGNATGFAENREVDRCMLVTSPPYFPTTGRYVLNRYYESDPARFDPAALFRSLQAY